MIQLIAKGRPNRNIVEDHAILIRCLFTSYHELGSVSALKCRLDAAGLHVPERRPRKRPSCESHSG